MPIVKIQDLHFSRGNHRIFNGIHLAIPRGKITGIMGPSGTGKTTLLKVIGGQVKPDKGIIEVDGKILSKLSNKNLFKLRMKMGMLFQSGALLTDLTVAENVAYPLREHTDLNNALIDKMVSLKLEAVGLRGAKNLMPTALSGGMARRVALARAIALDPLMIMYDEPFTGQDPISMGVLIELIKTLNKVSKLTSILVSHDIKETLQIADNIIILSDGKVVESGSPEKLKQQGSAWTQQFLNGNPDGPVPFHYPAPSFKEELGC